MKHVLCLGNAANLELAEKIPIEEILLQTTSFSRTGTIEDRRLFKCLEQLSEAGKKIILAWDVLVKDKDIERQANFLQSFADRVDAVRFADPGVGLFLKENFSDLEIQFSLEHCNANAVGISGWGEAFAPNLRRLILSNQIPISNIAKFAKAASGVSEGGPEIELLGLGRLQIFYSARRLLSRYVSIDQETDLSMKSREKGDERSCSVLENDRGTIMFHHKDICIADREEELEKAGVSALRFEFYSGGQYRLLARCFSRPNWIEEIARGWRRELDDGFFRENPTYRSLRRIANQVLRKERENQIGTVIEGVKGSHVLIEMHKEAKIPAMMDFISPEGGKISYLIKKATDLLGKKVCGRLSPGYYLLPWIRRAVPGTVIRPGNC